MIAGAILGLVAVGYGVAANNAGELWLGIFLLALCAIDPLADFVRREARLWRRVVRHDFSDRSSR